MLGGKLMLICSFNNGVLTGDALRVELNEETEEYEAFNLRTGKSLSNFMALSKRGSS